MPEATSKSVTASLRAAIDAQEKVKQAARDAAQANRPQPGATVTPAAGQERKA